MNGQELIDYITKIVADSGLATPEDLAQARKDIAEGLAEEPRSAELLERIAAGLQRVA